MSTRTRSTPIASIAITASLLVAACGVSGSAEQSEAPPTEESTTTTTAIVDEDPDQALADAVDATLAATAFTIDTEANLVITGQDVQLTAQGPLDYEGPGASVIISVEAPTGDGEIEIRSDGEKVWVRPEGSSDVGLPDDITWVEGDASRLFESETFEPTGLLGVLIALRAAEDTERLDTVEVDDVEATTYRTTVDYDEAVEAAGDDAEAFEAALSLTAPGSIDLLIDVTVGADGIIRTFSLDIDASTPQIDGDYQVEITDVGEPATAEAPPEDETLTGPEAEDLLDDLLT